MEKNYRIHTNVISDTVLNVNMTQDYDFLEVLSLKLRTADAYRLHSSNYGVIIGRVLANDAFGIPNAKVSVFIERDPNDPTYMESIYPYSEVMSTDRNNRRYNLLPDDSDDDCYRIVGTFPNKRLVLDDSIELEIYDKYWKFTTVTNDAGDYMIFGVPSGSQQVHVDIDLSDIGILSQTPRDFEHKGYNMDMFDSPSQFKESTNLESLAQIFSQNKSVFVYPFWGDANLGNGIAAITRCDIQIQYKFEPTCVFMGAIYSDNEGNSINHKCAANVDNGMNYQLVTGEGTIEMIRKTPDGLVEEFSIQGNQLIDSNGVWCYQIPMNLDFIGTDEYGNVIPTDNPNKGIPTRTQVRFRFSKSETGNEGHSRHTAKYLVPMNPTLVGSKPQTAENGQYIEKMYTFGSSTPDDCFRDMYWNNVYSVKNYIPKVQVAHRAYAPNYTGLKGSNLATDQNPVPFNKLRIDIPVTYVLICIIFGIVRTVVQMINIIINFVNAILNVFNILHDLCLDVGLFEICPFFFVPKLCCIGCLSLGGGLSPDNTAYYPACDHRGMNAADCPEDMENCKKSANSSDLMDLVQQKLAEDFKIVKLDFYQDWINGSLYMPLWYWRKSKKKTFLFFTLRSAKNEFCDCDRTYSRLKSYVTCNIQYTNKELGVSDGVLPESEDNWHRSSKRAARLFFPYGLIKGVENDDGLKAYYYTAIQPTDEAGIKNMTDREGGFPAFRLFATDIILLGNLNENNLYGIPQFFKALPSTTANIPPIASVQEAPDGEGGGTKSENVLADEGETGPSLVTGMDWIDGDGSPEYSDGLFMLLSCTYAHTKAKSCINVERLSELGMNLDMTYSTQYPTANGLSTGTFEHDGFITKYELDDMDNRAMFATLNHLGFVPQTYQNTKKNYNETQILDKNTNYFVPKFKFLYPTDLDGRMQPLIERYRNGFQQVVTDDADKAYINFRLGDVQPKNSVRGGQFYLNGNSMPLYNNSFYFYFGVNKGNTAIEKFNKMFLAQCFKNNKYPFSLDIKTRPQSNCKNIYKNDEEGYNYGESYIKVHSDDIQMPYSYTLVDSNGNETSAMTEIETRDFAIRDIDNDSYVLTVTDINGRSVKKRVNLTLDNISFVYEVRPLGKKYYHGGDGVSATTKNEICNPKGFNGEIRFSKILIDGYEFNIGNGTEKLSMTPSSLTIDAYAIPLEENKNIFNGSTEILGNRGFKALKLTITEMNDDKRIADCLCSGNSSSIDDFFVDVINIDGEYTRYFGFNVFIPDTYYLEGEQVCMSGTTTTVISANTTNQIAVIENGKNFQAYLNTMPIKFMMDNGTNFYPPKINSETTLSDNAWLNIHKETSYAFPKYSQKILWDDFLSLIDIMEDSYNKKAIIKYKFSRIFNLSKATFVNTNMNNKFVYSADGGIQPLLYRSLIPNYADEEKIEKTVVYSDNNYATINPAYPNIVGANYKDGVNSSTKRVNNLFVASNRPYIGNYFMAATNNGRYISQYRGNCSYYSESVPTSAAVNLTDEWKKLGENRVMTSIPDKAYTASTGALCQGDTQPYFKAMSVDRRLDMDLTVLGSVLNIPSVITFNDDSTNGIARRQTTSIRVLGIIYNGIEMAYDDNYNIISAILHSGSTSETRQVVTLDEYGNEVTDASGNPIMHDETIIIPNPSGDVVETSTTLEYTYYYSSGYNGDNTSVDIKLNNVIGSQNYHWKNYGDDVTSGICKYILTSNSSVNPNEDGSYSANTPLMKSLYAANIGGIDIRQLMWSSKNSNFMIAIGSSLYNNWKKYDPSIPMNVSGTLPFYFRFPQETNPYNDTYDSSNYPTKRYIDFGKIEPSPYFNFSLTPCSYDLNVEENENGLITSTINPGVPIDVSLTFGSIEPSPRGNKEEYGHFIYNMKVESDARKTISIDKIGLGMQYREMDYDTFDAYSKTMRILNIDNIRQFKTQAGRPSIADFWNNLTRLEKVGVYAELEIRQINHWKNDGEYEEDYPYSIDELGFLRYADRKMTCNDDRLYICRVGCSGWDEIGARSSDNFAFIQDKEIKVGENFNFSPDYPKFLVACGERDLFPMVKDNMTSTIKIYDFSEFYDCRDIETSCSAIKNSDGTCQFRVTIYKHNGNSAYNQSFNTIKNVGAMVQSRQEIEPTNSFVFNIFLEEADSGEYTFSVTQNSESIVIKTNGNINLYGGQLEFIYIYVTSENGAIYKIILDVKG